MRRPSLDEYVRDHYDSASPSPQLLDRLVAATRDVGAEPSGVTPDAAEAEAPVRTARPTSWRFLWAAALIIALSGGWFVQSRLSTTRVAQSVAAEIVMNHVKDLDVEVRSTTWDELRQSLDKLDFALAGSSRLESRDLRLQGGRYCSIQGKLAAQIRMAGPGGERLTLYQTATTEDLTGLDRTLTASGVEVEMWTEQGLFFGLAQSPPD